jgi:quercetin dioxygenase-like cupin family protein
VKGFMTLRIVSKRDFSLTSLQTLPAVAAGTLLPQAAAGQAPAASTRRDVIRQGLPGEPMRHLTLVEVTYPPGAGSPPHLHANGVMAFVVSGAVASKVGDAPEQTFHAGDAW